jgi:hypothetical protein
MISTDKVPESGEIRKILGQNRAKLATFSEDYRIEPFNFEGRIILCDRFWIWSLSLAWKNRGGYFTTLSLFGYSELFSISEGTEFLEALDKMQRAEFGMIYSRKSWTR